MITIKTEKSADEGEQKLQRCFRKDSGQADTKLPAICSSISRQVQKKHPSFAFKFGRRVHFALRRKMLKPPIARLSAI